jgi:DNA-binding beta-propeller fold protein YncE
MTRLLLVPALAALLAAADYRTPAGTRPAHAKLENTVLPGGRLLTPIGQQYFTGPGVFGLALSPDGNTLVTADGGPNRYSLTILRRDGDTWRTSRIQAHAKNDPEDDKDDDWRSVFMGLAFADDNTLYASEGNSGRVRVVDVRDGKKRHTINLNTDGFHDSYSGDLALDRTHGLLYVVDQANFRLAVVDIARQKPVASLRVGRLPFAIALSPDAKRVYVTNIGIFEYKIIPGADANNPLKTGLLFPAFGFPSKEAETGRANVPGLGKPNVVESNSVAVVDVSDATRPKMIKFIPTGTPIGKRSDGGSSPSGVTATADRVFVSNAHNDSISIIGADSLKVEREIPIRIPGLETVRGVMPIGLAWDDSGSKLLVAEAGINAIGVVDVNRGQVLGHLPSGWFPTRVTTRGEMVYVTNAKGVGTGPNKGLAKSFQAELRRGMVSVFPMPKSFDNRVSANNGFEPENGEEAKLPAQIKYVVLIVKENRTFDEVFGADARYGQQVTPNHHAIAKRWSGSDNFYADSEVSVDGHHWLVGSYPDAWTESSLMAAYGGQKDFRLTPEAPGRLLFAESNSSVHPEEQPEAGTLWHHLERNHIPFRNFGEGYELAGVYEGEGAKPTGARFLTNIPMPDPLYRNTSRNYAQFNMNIPDQYRATQLIAELKGTPNLPRFIYIHLPNDHTAKPRPADGYPTDASYVADNDYALGRIMTFLSQRPEWKQMAVFVTEDDSQGGVDPVDSHRTALMIASPYAKQGYISHENSSFPGLLKTIFHLLRMPPLNLYDATATDLSDCFTNEPNFGSFVLQPVDKQIFDPSKAREPPHPKPSVKMDDPRALREQHRQ